MQSDYPRFQEQNTEILALVVAPQERVQSAVKRLNLPYPFLADADHAISSAYGVYNLLNDNLATPSVFVVEENGLVVWSYVGRHANDRPTAQQILDQLSIPPS